MRHSNATSQRNNSLSVDKTFMNKETSQTKWLSTCYYTQKEPWISLFIHALMLV